MGFVWGLYIMVVINGQQWEAVPAVFDTQEECIVYAQQYVGVVQDMDCFHGLLVEVHE